MWPGFISSLPAQRSIRFATGVKMIRFWLCPIWILLSVHNHQSSFNLWRRSWLPLIWVENCTEANPLWIIHILVAAIKHSKAEGRLFPHALSISLDCSMMLIDFPPSRFISRLRLLHTNNGYSPIKFACILGIEQLGFYLFIYYIFSSERRTFFPLHLSRCSPYKVPFNFCKYEYGFKLNQLFR